MDLNVGIGDYRISDRDGDIIKTYALSSCVAVTAYSPVRKVAGMIHVARPEPTEGEQDINPAYYASTGIPLLIEKMCRDYGCTRHELQVSLYGGADSSRRDDMFNLGKRNVHTACMILESLGMYVWKVETDGRMSRTLYMDVSKGDVRVRKLPLKI